MSICEVCQECVVHTDGPREDMLWLIAHMYKQGFNHRLENYGTPQTRTKASQLNIVNTIVCLIILS